MSKMTQYGRADEMSLAKRLSIVAKLRGMGFSEKKIAHELGYSTEKAIMDIAAISDKIREFDNLDTYLKDVTTRTGEQLTSLNNLKAILWKQLDWASEWVPQVIQAPDGSFIPEIDQDGERVYGPRRPHQVTALTKEIASLDKQIAELLGIMHKNVDITVTLEKTEKTQVIILELIKDAAPEVYRNIRRQIQAVLASTEQNRAALVGNKTIEDVIEADYKVLADAATA